jgi:ATP-dependent Lhr-like helicase
VVQVEAPPSVASGMQRIGRAGHQVGAVSEGVVFPKFRGDLVASAAVVEDDARRAESKRAATRAIPSTCSRSRSSRWSPWSRGTSTSSSPRSDGPLRSRLSRPVFEGVLDMLAGRYPSDEFAELKPRVTWDRVAHTLTPRQGARHIAIVNGGTIPDRGLYGVFLAGATTGTARVGELDEEMVFETRVGETFLLGRRRGAWKRSRTIASSCLRHPVSRARCRSGGAMPRDDRSIWDGASAGWCGSCVRRRRPWRWQRLTDTQGLDPLAARNLLAYLADQAAATREVPDDRTIVIERSRDELGDWRVCVLSPFGGRLHAPWAMAPRRRCARAAAPTSTRCGPTTASWCGFPTATRRPTSPRSCRDRTRSRTLVLGELGSTALFAARFREVAARALLLPKRRPGGRAPLWQQRKRAADLLAVAAQYGSFPMLLETYRECLRDVFDMPALVETLAASATGRFARSPWTRTSPPHLPRRSSSATSRTSSTRRTRRSPSVARTRSRSTRRSSASSSATPSSASCSTQSVLAQLERELQRLEERFPRAIERRRPRSSAGTR